MLLEFFVAHVLQAQCETSEHAVRFQAGFMEHGCGDSRCCLLCVPSGAVVGPVRTDRPAALLIISGFKLLLLSPACLSLQLEFVNHVP